MWIRAVLVLGVGVVLASACGGNVKSDPGPGCETLTSSCTLEALCAAGFCDNTAVDANGCMRHS